VHPPPSPARANFTLMTECTPESSGCYSVYSVEGTLTKKKDRLDKTRKGTNLTLVEIISRDSLASHRLEVVI
jgi:hypothetical protein